MHKRVLILIFLTHHLFSMNDELINLPAPNSIDMSEENTLLPQNSQCQKCQACCCNNIAITATTALCLMGIPVIPGLICLCLH